MASLVFLIGVSLIYAASGTLNIADPAPAWPCSARRTPGCCRSGGGAGARLLTKGAMWPLGFWLPTTHASASAPVGAMLVLMTKGGRVCHARAVAGGVRRGAEAAGGLQLRRADPRRHGDRHCSAPSACSRARTAGAWRAMARSCPRHAAGGDRAFRGAVLASGLYYLLGSTLAMAAFMLLIELLSASGPPGAAPITDHRLEPSRSRTSRRIRSASAFPARSPSSA